MSGASSLARAPFLFRDAAPGASSRLYAGVVCEVVFRVERASLELLRDRGRLGDRVERRTPIKPFAEVLLVGTGTAGPVRGIAIARGGAVLASRAVAFGVDPKTPGPSTLEPRSSRADALVEDADGVLVLPTDLDARAFQSAHEDQWLPAIEGGEQLLVAGLSTRDVELRLPVLRPWATLSMGARRIPVPMVFDTMVVDLDAREVALHARGHILAPKPSKARDLLDPEAWSCGLAPAVEIGRLRRRPSTWSRPDSPRGGSVDPLVLVDRSGFVAAALSTPPDSRVVVVKGTFRLGDGPPVADDDRAPLDDETAGDGAARASDFVPFKPRVDVLVRGTARGAPGRTSTVVDVAIASVAMSATQLVDRPLVAFAPVLADAPARRALLGSYDRAWLERAWPAFPSDFDPHYFQAAAPQLTADTVPLGSAFRIGSVLPGGAPWMGRLPTDRPRAFVAREGTEPEEVPLRLDTVTLDADALRIELVWRGGFRLTSREPTHLVVVRDDASAARVDAQVALALHGPWDQPPASTVADVPVPLPALLAARRAAKAGVFDAALAAPPPAAPPPPSRKAIEALVAAGTSLARRDLTGADLSGARLDGADLRRAMLASAVLTGASLAGARLDGANLVGASLDGANLDGASLERADLTAARAAAASLRGARLGLARFADADLRDARLDDVDASRTSFERATLERASLERAVLRKADLTGARLRDAVVTGTIIEDAKLDGVVGERARFDRTSGADPRFEGATLDAASFADARIDGAVFERASLRAAVFDRAHISAAVFTDATLEGSKLGTIVGRGAIFRGADLTRAALVGADLREASFESARLSGADLGGANLHGAETIGADLRDARLHEALLTGTKLAPSG